MLTSCRLGSERVLKLVVGFRSGLPMGSVVSMYSNIQELWAEGVWDELWLTSVWCIIEIRWCQVVEVVDIVYFQRKSITAVSKGKPLVLYLAYTGTAV